MAEVIRERVVDRPAERVYERSGSGMGMIVGIILLIAFLYLMFMYALPMIRSAATPQQVVPNVQVPDKINVDVNTPAQK
jgi:hypothetical protein